MQKEKQEGIIKWVSKSDKNNSFNLETDPTIWYRLRTIDEDKIESVLNSGDEIRFFYSLEGAERVVDTIPDIVSKSVTEQKKEGWQDDMVSFEDLLNEAHKQTKGVLEIRTKLIYNDAQGRKALFKAKVKTQKGVFEAYGDADQSNVGKMIAPHYIRMAETRAIARALRWATNNASTSKEEIIE